MSENGNEIRTFLKQKEAPIIDAHDYTGYLPDAINVDSNLAPGDIFGFYSIGTTHHNKYGNSDNQNGIILSNTIPGVKADDVRVFSHMITPEDRDTSLGDMLRLLSTFALKKGITMDNFTVKGGVECMFAGFYATLAKSLV